MKHTHRVRYKNKDAEEWQRTGLMPKIDARLIALRLKKDWLIVEVYRDEY